MSSIVVRPGLDKKAVSKTTAYIIMMADAALGQLRDLGYERGFDDVKLLESEDTGFPYITYRDQEVFKVFFDADPGKGLFIKGEWVGELPRKKRLLWALRAYRWVIKKLSGTL